MVRTFCRFVVIFRQTGHTFSGTPCRPLQKFNPLETAENKTCQEGQKGKGGMDEAEKSEEKRNPMDGRPSRAEAKDVQWRARLMLDS